MTIYDISPTLSPSIAVWPGDSPFELESIAKLENGAPVNLTTLHLSAHTGSHADAPRHFAANAPTIDEVDLHPYWGPAQVVSISKPGGALHPSDLDHVDLQLAPRLLLRTRASEVAECIFPREIVYPSPQFVEFLQGHDIILLGTDCPSMDALDSKILPGHQALYKAGLAILEGLRLGAVPTGLYELVALPLRIQGGDGSPVRAALRT